MFKKDFLDLGFGYVESYENKLRLGNDQKSSWTNQLLFVFNIFSTEISSYVQV